MADIKRGWGTQPATNTRDRRNPAAAIPPPKIHESYAQQHKGLRIKDLSLNLGADLHAYGQHCPNS